MQSKVVNIEQMREMYLGRPVWMRFGIPDAKGETNQFPPGAPKHYRLAEIPGKGLGMFATRSLVLGDRVTSEHPIAIVNSLKHMMGTDSMGAESWLRSRIKELPTGARDAIEQLHDAPKVKYLHYSGVVQTNAFDVPDFEFVLMKDVSRINHSCQHNCEWIWDKHAMAMHIVAIKPIAKGEEITIHYGKAQGTKLQRQWNLERRYGFKCTCDCCKLEGEALMASDDRRIEIGRLGEVLARNHTIHGFRPIPDLTPIRDLLNLHAAEGERGTCIADLYFDATRIANFHGDVVRASHFLSLCNTTHSVIRGEHLNLKLENIRDPGGSNGWLTVKSELPMNTRGKKFEEWLWNPPKVQWTVEPVKEEQKSRTWAEQMTLTEKKVSQLIHYCQKNRVDPAVFVPNKGDTVGELNRKKREYMKMVVAAWNA